MVSRAKRLEEAINSINSAKEIVEELKNEMQEWYDNMPENLQSSDKADRIQECVSSLEEVSSSLDDAESNASNVEFVGMFG